MKCSLTLESSSVAAAINQFKIFPEITFKWTTGCGEELKPIRCCNCNISWNYYLYKLKKILYVC